MKITHLADTDGGGAGRAFLRIHSGLIEHNINSTALVFNKKSGFQSVITPYKYVWYYKFIQAKLANQIFKKIFGNTKAFSVNCTPSLILKQIQNLNSDIIHLHWVGREFLNISDFQMLNTPLIWTLPDMWGFTGGCHYTGDCKRYTNSCGACPELRSSKDSDLTRWVWERKSKAWKNLNLTIISPSSWLADCARASSLFQNLRIEVIPYALDIHKYKPCERKASREFFNLPQNKKLVLFGAINATKDTRKGFHLLQQALENLKNTEWIEKCELVVFGASQAENPIDLGFKVHYLGRLNDDSSLARAYSAADVMVIPSVQEAFGQTGSESLSCGTPVVAFDDTGLKDIVDHQQNGYLAKPYEVEDLARGITWVLKQQEEEYQKLCFYAREKAEKEFSLEIQSRRYLSLYEEILAQKSKADRLIRV